MKNAIAALIISTVAIGAYAQTPIAAHAGTVPAVQTARPHHVHRHGHKHGRKHLHKATHAALQHKKGATSM